MKKNILLVDDESIFHFLNSKIITLSGVDCDIKSATDGKHALDMLNEHYLTSAQVHFIFIDLDMPKMNGFQFITAFNQLTFTNKEKITLVVLSSSETEQEKELVQNLGVKHYLSKPLSEGNVKSLMTA
jgi:CheY-like chemotaxis protein